MTSSMCASLLVHVVATSACLVVESEPQHSLLGLLSIIQACALEGLLRGVWQMEYTVFKQTYG